MREVIFIIFMLLGLCLSFLAGVFLRETELLKDLGGEPLKQNGRAAADADSYYVEKLDKGSYALGYFQGRDEAFNEVLDLIDKKERRKRHDRRRKK